MLLAAPSWGWAVAANLLLGANQGFVWSMTSISLLVTDRTLGEEPWMVLTGDTLFVGDVGRPDSGDADAAHTLCESLHAKLMESWRRRCVPSLNLWTAGDR